MPKKNNGIIYCCFFLSGISGLIYEVLWAKYLVLIFGNTTHAHTLVLSTFMGGLALGSFFLGRLADRVESRLSLFAWVQMGIGLYCFFTPDLFQFSKNIYIPAAKSLSLNPIGVLIIKFVIGAIIMLPPTILMGGTLPILTKFITQSLDIRGQTVARLYYVNSFGAVAGTLLAGFYLIQTFGLHAALTTAVFINLFVGLIVILLKDRLKNTPVKSALPEEAAPQKEEIIEEDIPSKLINISLIGIFISGFIAMLYEVVWIRLLSAILGGSTYSFSLMLAAFISGITIGSFLISRFMPNTRRAFLYFGLCEAFIGISLMLSLPFYEKLPFLFLKLSSIFARTRQTFVFYSTIKFLLAFLVMFLPTLFLGMTLPLVSKIASRGLKSLGRKVGGVFACNTSGNILGALITGLFILPALGLKHTIEFGIIINLLLGIIVLFADKLYPIKRKLVFASACCMAFIGYKMIIPDWNKSFLTTQLFRFGGANMSPAQLSEMIERKKVLFYKDGLDVTVAITTSDDEVISLTINGKIDASTGGDMPTQILSAQLPMALKPDIKDVLVVGLGSGITCGSALLHPIKSLDLLEISSSVVEANRYFNEYNYKPFEDERLRLYVEDAKTFLQKTDNKYDLIISEPSNPWMSGIASLFSVEYFSDCRKRLNKGGLMIQWLQAYETNDEIFETVLRTFSSVFPEVTVWNTGARDILLLGSEERPEIDFEKSEQVLNLPEIKDDLARINIKDLFTLLNLQLGSDKSVRRPSRSVGTLVNSDFFPNLEYMAPVALYMKSKAESSVMDLERKNLPLQKSDLFLKDYLADSKITHDNLRNLYGYIEKQQAFNRGFLRALTKRWHEEYPQSKEAIEAYALYNIDSVENGMNALEPLVFKHGRLQNLRDYSTFVMSRHRLLNYYLLPDVLSQTAEKLMRCAGIAGPDEKPGFYYLLGNVFAANDDYSKAIAYYAKAEELLAEEKEISRPSAPSYPQLLRTMSFTYLRAGDFPKAYEYAIRALSLDKNQNLARLIIRYIERIGK